MGPQVGRESGVPQRREWEKGAQMDKVREKEHSSWITCELQDVSLSACAHDDERMHEGIHLNGNLQVGGRTGRPK
jgi:hypothetical protein